MIQDADRFRTVRIGLQKSTGGALDGRTQGCARLIKVEERIHGNGSFFACGRICSEDIGVNEGDIAALNRSK